MSQNLKSGFSPGVSSENSPQMTDTTSGSHAPPVVTVKTRRLDAGKQSTALDANGPHQGNSRCPAAPAVQPETYDLSSGDAEAQSVRSSTIGNSISVASSTTELLARKAVLKQKRLAAEARAAVEAAEAEAVAVEAKAAVTKKIAEARVAAATEAAKLEEVEIDAQIAAEEAQQSRASVSDESLELSASPLPPQALQEPFEKNGQHQGNSWCQAACPAAEGNEPPLWSNPFLAKPEVVQTKVENATGNLPFYGEEAVFVDAVDGQVEESAQVEGVAERRPFDQWEDVEGVAERRSFTQRDDIAVETVPLFYESMEFQDPVEGSAGGPTLIQQNFVTNNSCEINSTVINQAQIID